jgi:uncharacterized protein YqjF (DUF2071 family)
MAHPSSPVFLSAEWRSLAMLNYEADPGILRPLVPRGTELDTWDGKHFISLVGFMFLNTKVRGMAVPFHRNFEEVNLRFYVRHKDGHQWRRGVVFIKEIVPRFAIATIARVLYNENYVAMPMRHFIGRENEADTDTTVRYEWYSRKKWNNMTLQIQGPATLPPPGSEAEFITEHYWGYVSQRNGDSMEYRVGHPQWRVWQAVKTSLDCDIGALYGPQFAAPLSATPHSAFVAEGSAIEVHQGKKI